MELVLTRMKRGEECTIGLLTIDGVEVCDTLEPKERDLTKERKVKGRTAIPTGRYEVVVNRSPKFGRLLPRLWGVPGFEGILIHRGNTAKDTAGCILVGKYAGLWRLAASTAAEMELTERLLAAQRNGERIWIVVK